MSSFTCPKCQGPREAKALYCAFCGIIFARYSAAPAAAQSPALAPRTPAGRPSLAPPAEPGRVEETILAGPPPPPVGEGADRNPYQGPAAALDAVSAYELATPVTRLAAQFLNGLIVSFLMAGGLVVAILLASISDNKNVLTALVMLGMGLPLTIWVIRNLRQLAETGQSMGKKWMGIRIVRTSGEKPALSQLVILRFLPIQLASAIPVLGPAVGLVNVLMIFGEEQRCLHDRIADTLVVKC